MNTVQPSAADRFTAAAETALAKYAARCQNLAERMAHITAMPDGPDKDAATDTFAVQVYAR